MWQSLARAVKAGVMPTVDRLGILDDAFALARAGYIDTSTALSVLMAYDSEQDFSVWTIIAGVFSTLDNLLSPEPDRESLHEAARRFFQAIASAKGWNKQEGDGHLDVMLRSLALRNLGGYGDRGTIDEARNRFEQFRREGSLDPDLRQSVYTLVAENGGEKEYRDLLEIYNGTQLHEERVSVLNAAGSCKQEPVLRELLQFSLSEGVRSQDTPIVMASASNHSLGKSLAWEFFKQNWDTFVDRYNGGGIGLLSRIIGIAGGFTQSSELADVESFFQAHPVPGTERAVKKTVEILRSNVAWRERSRSEILAYFAEQKTPAAAS